jgi:AcrR family transcriptional regulator
VNDEGLSRRQRQAAQTRQDIVDAARRLFADRGYAGTSVAEIARAAEVSVQTVYDSVGSKKALLVAINDRLDEAAGVVEVLRGVREETDPLVLVAVPAAITRRFLESGGDVVRASLAAAASDADLASVYEEGLRRHRLGVGRLIRRIDEVGGLLPGLHRDEAADVASALTDTRVALVFLDGYEWDLDRWEAWVVRALRRELLGR